MSWFPLAAISLRARLVLLVLLAMLPLAGTLLADLVADRGDALEGAWHHAEELARLGAEQQDGLLQEARTVLAVLARVPQVASAAPGSCHDLMRQLVADHPRMASLLVTDDTGAITCNSITPHPQVNIGNRRYVQQLLQPGRQGYELSDVAVSLATNRPALFVGLALPPAVGTGRPAGIVSAGLNLDWLQGMAAKLAQDSSGHDGSGTAIVLDTRDGSVLALSSGSIGLADRPASDHPVLKAYRRAPGQAGRAEGAGLDGIERVYGYAPLPGTDGDAILVVGFARQQVLAHADMHLWAALAVTFAAVLAAVACTLLAAWGMFIRPGRVIMDMAARLSAGDLDARVALPPRQAPELRLLADTLNTMVASVASAQARLAESELAFRRLAGTDGLTGLPNRRMFAEAYDREWRRAARDGIPLSLLLLDVDHFKLFNDSYGHLAGDDCLRAIADAVTGVACRPGDLAARFGGEEFVVLLPGADLAGAAEVAERMRQAVAALGLEHAGNPACGGMVTVSVGMATTRPVLDADAAAESPPGEATGAKAELLVESDTALYVAKAAGRNQVGTIAPAMARPVPHPGTEAGEQPGPGTKRARHLRLLPTAARS